MSYNDFQIFVKPAGAECNLNCSYCYYINNTGLHKDFSMMADDILEKYISSHFEACPDDVVNFSWHGGEPLLAGIDFYRKAVAFQKRYKPGNVAVSNGIQTNGTMLNDEWCRFFSEEGFCVGVSIDGPQEFHDRFRVSRDGLPSFTRTMNGIRLLRKHGIIPEILCVVNSYNVRQPLKIYNFIRKTGAKFVSFLPLVEKRPDLPAGVSSNSVPSLEFGIFLSKIFDQWVLNGIGDIKIQIFEEAARTAFSQDHTLCIFKKTCGGVPVLERNGDFYSCDHYTGRQYLVGNIRSRSLKELLESPQQIKFGRAKLDTLPAYCINCGVRNMCNGECPKNRFISSPDGEPGLNYLCEGYRYFFNHCKPFVEAISQVWKSC